FETVRRAPSNDGSSRAPIVEDDPKDERNEDEGDRIGAAGKTERASEPHNVPAAALSPRRRSTSSLMYVAMSVVVVPGPNSFPTPDAVKDAMSSSGMIPPPVRRM